MYIMRLKKITWLQAYFLRDVRVIWCDSLGDSHFQIYVMNNIEIVNDYDLHITSHVYHAITNCTHYTSYFLLNLVHKIVSEVDLTIQDYMFLDVDTKYVCWLIFEDKLIEKLVFGRFELNSSVFEKLLISYSCISFIKQCALKSLCIKMLCFSKI